MTFPSKPAIAPADPRFSPGPTRKHPGWKLENLKNATLGRNHRCKASLDKLKLAIDRTRDVLRVPADYRIAIVPGSDTGAVEMAMWGMLGKQGVDVFAWENFGKDWVIDAVEQLKLPDLKVHVADYGELPDFSQARPNRDVVFTWNGTTSGVRVTDCDWMPEDRDNIVICDATSGAFAQELDWPKLDVVTFSWQKVLGGEAAHGMLILSPRAVKRLESYTPSWPVPKVFRMTTNGKLDEALFQGSTINTPSLLCVEDYLDALDWAESLGGLDALYTRANANAKIIYDWIDSSDWAAPLCKDPTYRSNTGVCLVFKDPGHNPAGLAARIAELLAENQAGYDCSHYRTAPPGMRIWTGATVEASDLKALTAWADWAYATARAEQDATAIRKAG
jgi:phosphoserine aminotransferase